MRHLIRDGSSGHRPVVSVLVVRVSGLLRDLGAVHRFLRLGAAEGGDTCHVQGSLVKLRRCTGYLRACHDQQEISTAAATGEPDRGVDVCGECVNQPG
jgi:hypothetical protein